MKSFYLSHLMFTSNYWFKFIYIARITTWKAHRTHWNFFELLSVYSIHFGVYRCALTLIKPRKQQLQQAITQNPNPLWSDFL